MRYVFFISDHTGITVETLGNALLSQFRDIEFISKVVPFVDNLDKVEIVLLEIEALFVESNERVIVFSSINNPQLRAYFSHKCIFHLDCISQFTSLLEREFAVEPVDSNFHGIVNLSTYNKRISAIEYSMHHDDGISVKHLSNADIILVGVSRVGKTPTCLYLAVNHGINAANYPLVEDDIKYSILPKEILKHKHKLFGLMIDVDVLHSIRSNRVPKSNYSARNTCVMELESAHNLMQRYMIPTIDVTNKSIEEISAVIMQKIGN